jgi:type IV pilus assembly protein PilB
MASLKFRPPSAENVPVSSALSRRSIAWWRMADSDALARVLVERELLPASEVERWLRLAATERCFLEQILTREQVLPRARLLEILENHFFCPAADLGEEAYDPALLKLIPQRFAERHLVFPIGSDGDRLKIAFADPDNAPARRAVSQMLLRPVVRMVALRHELHELIQRAYPRLAAELAAADQRAAAAAPAAAAQARTAVPPLRLSFNATDAVRVVDQLLDSADKRGATDVHFEHAEDEMVVRFRIDGLLQEATRVPKELATTVVSRIKILAEMDISEKRLPQDGRMTVKRDDHLLDLRASSLPSQFGEKLVLRLLRKQTTLLDIENLKMPPAVRALHEEMIRSPAGLFLVTGPTGSGKTTTLYSTLKALDRGVLNVVTLENPIEYSLPGITQCQIHEAAGMTFEVGLETILRQDPDVILVGEIRDAGTVETACRASLTGHKVFSTLHTNDAAEAVTRLLDMGCLPYLIAATVRGVLAQRLIRVICGACKEPYTPNPSELAVLGHPPISTLQRGAGCPECDDTGYKGRMALFEYLRVGEHLHRLILERASTYTIRHAAERNGLVPMAEFAKRAVIEGVTTVAEIQRVLLADDGKERLCQGCQRVVSSEFAVCPFCQHVLKETCGHCEAPVEGNWDACPRCGHGIDREWQRLYCRHCVAPIERAGGACPYCGGDT